MCTYDYTPYTGCKDGEQHFFIQWMKCHKAVENNRYCSMRKSTQTKALSRLSSNVLACPLHGPIAVQQHVLDSLSAESLEGVNARGRHQETERPRPRLSRTTKEVVPRESFERGPRKEVRKRRPARDTSPASSDSDSSVSLVRPKTSDGVKRATERSFPERRKTSIAHEASHRRANSADFRRPSRALSVHHVRSEASLPRASETEAVPEVPPLLTTLPNGTRPKASLAIPTGNGVIGLPSSPDMHHRANAVHRSKSESVLRQEEEAPAESIEPVPRTTYQSASDSSPDHASEQLPFSNPTARRGRRTGARSVRDRSVDTVMRRIDEHVVPEDVEAPGESTRRETGHIRASISTTSRSSRVASPEPQHRHTHTRSLSPPQPIADPRPQLHNLQIPKQREQYQRGGSPASASPPQPAEASRPQSRKSLRHGKSASNLNPHASPPQPHHDPETASLRSTRSRRFEDQVAEGRKWAAAREHMPIHGTMASSSVPRGLTDVLAYMSEPNLPLAGPNHAGRESIDSGYRSGTGYGPHYHQRQRSREMNSVVPPKRLQKAQPQEEIKGLGEVEQQQQQQQVPRHVPAPLDLSSMGRLPPCALPVSLMSPGLPGATRVTSSEGSEKAKVSLLQRMGFRKKWGRGGREVDVEG